MKAIVYHRYGSPDVLACEEIDRPTPEDDQVLIEVRAASVNPFDWHFMRGTPYFMRVIAGLRKPKIAGLGVDVAGRVEAVGKNVTRFKRGDEVFGTCRGAFAEYACAPEAELADGVEVGADTAYEIRVTNTGSKTETNLQLICTVPDKMEFRGARGAARASPPR